MTTKKEYKDMDIRYKKFIKQHKARKKNIGFVLILDRDGWIDIASINTKPLLDFIHDWERWVLNKIERLKTVN